MNDVLSPKLDVDAQVAANKQVVSGFSKDITREQLATFERDIRLAFVRVLAELTGAPLPEARITHFAGRKKWVDAKKAKTDLTPLQHIEDVYPDRREFDLRRCDLLDPRIDPKLYQALADWLRDKNNRIPADFGLPKKSEITDAVLEKIRAMRKPTLMDCFSAPDAAMIRALKARDARVAKKAKLQR